MTPDDAIALVQKYGNYETQGSLDTFRQAACVLAGEVERLREDNAMFDGTTKHQDDLLVVVGKECDELRRRAATLEEFVSKVAEQKPEKPDYWSSCGQCDRNIDDAEELMKANQIEGGG